jgi:hypothetical protein
LFATLSLDAARRVPFCWGHLALRFDPQIILMTVFPRRSSLKMLRAFRRVVPVT